MVIGLLEPEQAVVDLLMVMVTFGDAGLAGEAGPPVLYRHRTCGEVSHVVPPLRALRRAMHAREIDVLPGPGLSA
ncbi:hypothetical protein [Isoptericola jiangsuensis]|uniref:hypothetical protein n=1 Tax=Isoptericola jiangsuensis TaxID=548579 RepID=UPI000BF3038D|nr:hypothetical protein [Isoptericola jiangsuensis]